MITTSALKLPTDTYRVFHKLWHCFISLLSWLNRENRKMTYFFYIYNTEEEIQSCIWYWVSYKRNLRFLINVEVSLIFECFCIICIFLYNQHLYSQFLYEYCLEYFFQINYLHFILGRSFINILKRFGVRLSPCHTPCKWDSFTRLESKLKKV